MQVQASSIGYAVPRGDFDAAIQSVFDTAVNLKPADQTGLITLFMSERHDLPQGIRLDSKGINFKHLKVGDRAACRAGILHLPSLIISLHGARPWRCDLSSLNIDIKKPEIKAAWEIVFETLDARQVCKNAELRARDIFQGSDTTSALGCKLNPAVKTLVISTRHYDLPAAGTAVKTMIGLGPGVTPSGDDVLLGYLAALWSTLAGRRERISFLSSFSAAIMRLTYLTNEISNTYLFHAIRGQFSSNLVALVDAIGRGLPHIHLISLAEDAMRAGHSSGMDMVTGLLAGLAVWNPELV